MLEMFFDTIGQGCTLMSRILFSLDPEVIHTDNGTEFASKLLKQICRTLEIIHTSNPVYHSQANPYERVNQILKTMIVAFLHKNHKEWDIHLPEFRFDYTTAFHGMLKV